MAQPTVTINVRCDRTEKEKPVNVTVDNVQTVLAHVAAKQTAAVTIQKELEAVVPGNLPDLIVCFRGKICVLANVHESSDAVISRYLEGATNRENLFTVDPSKIKRKPRKVVKEVPEEPAE